MSVAFVSMALLTGHYKKIILVDLVESGLVIKLWEYRKDLNDNILGIKILDYKNNIDELIKVLETILFKNKIKYHMINITMYCDRTGSANVSIIGGNIKYEELVKITNEAKDNKEIKQKDTGFGKLLPFKKQEELEKKEE